MFSEETLFKAVAILQAGGTILYPTDTIWGIGCDATNEQAVKQIFTIKKRHEAKSLIILVANFTMLQKYVKVSDIVVNFLEKSDKPTSVVYIDARGLASGVTAQDGSVAARIVKDDFCSALISKFGRPIVSTSANISGQPTAKIFAEINDDIKKNVDYIVDYKQDSNHSGTSSRLIQFRDNNIIILRE